MTIIDVHCHMATPSSRTVVEAHRRPEYEPYDYFMGQSSREHNKVMIPQISDQLTTPEARLEPMDRMGVEIQGLATFVSEYFYWAPATAAAESARIQNDHLAAVAEAHPDRFALFGRGGGERAQQVPGGDRGQDRVRADVGEVGRDPVGDLVGCAAELLRGHVPGVWGAQRLSP